MEELQDHRRYTTKVSGAIPAAQVFRKSLDFHEDMLRMRIQVADRRREYIVHASGFAECEVFSESSRIKVEIACLIELEGIHENTGGHHRASTARFLQ